MRAPSKPSTLQLPELAGLDQPGLFDTRSAPTGEPLIVPIDRLDEDPHNPRTEFPPLVINELAQDIAQRGVLQPIVVSAADENGRYRIRFGGKRWRAAKQAGLAEVPVILATRAHDAYDQVAENLKRNGLSPLELAAFIRGQVDAGESNAAIAKRLVIDQTTVAHPAAYAAISVLHRPVESALETCPSVAAGRLGGRRSVYDCYRWQRTGAADPQQSPRHSVDLPGSGRPGTT